MSDTDSNTTNNMGSSMSANVSESATSLSAEPNAEQLKRQLAIYEEQLRRSHALTRGNNDKYKNKLGITIADDEISRRKKFSRSHDKILNNMLRIMDTCKTRGFVYGIVTENGKPVSGASDSLRAWWKEKVRFDVNGPAAVDKFYNENSHPLGFQPNDQHPKSIFEMLMELSDMTLGSVLSTLMQQCDPPQRKFPLEKGLPPPWWPKGNETWMDQAGIPSDQRDPPFRKPHDLRKSWKATVLISVIKHMSPDFSRLSLLIENSKCLKERMRAKEIKMWGMVVRQEVQLYQQNYANMPHLGGQVRVPNQSHIMDQPNNRYPMQQTWPVVHQNCNFGNNHGIQFAQNQQHGVNNEFVYDPMFSDSGNRARMDEGNFVMNEGNPRGGNTTWFF